METQLQELGWSQAYLASRLGVTAATITGWKARGVPRSATAYLDAMVRQKRIRDLASAELDPPRGRPRGRSFGSEPEVDPYGLAGGSQATVDGREYRSKLDRWEAADMDQDGDEWGRG